MAALFTEVLAEVLALTGVFEAVECLIAAEGAA
jgi:hypothetical protein